MKRLSCALALAAACSALAVHAASTGPAYPSKPIRLVLPFAPGGVGDITARAVTQKMSESMGQQIIIDNRPSAGGIVASELVAKAEPDGYTLMLLNNTNAVSAALFRKLPYDTLRDFEMISTVGAFSIVVLVAPESPFKTVKDLIAYAKANPGRLNLGSINIGTTQHLSAELFKSLAGIDVVTVPFNNTAGVITALRGNSVQVAFEFVPAVIGQVKAGALRAIAASQKERFTALPNVPTVAESGVPAYDVTSWNGIAAPARTPPAIIERLNREIHAAVNSPAIRARFQELSVDPNVTTPEAMRKFVGEEIAKWNAVIDKAGIPRQ